MKLPVADLDQMQSDRESAVADYLAAKRRAPVCDCNQGRLDYCDCKGRIEEWPPLTPRTLTVAIFIVACAAAVSALMPWGWAP